MKSDPEFSTLVDALRADLPSERESARLRARLSALGVAASTGISTTAAAAAGAAAKTSASGAGVAAQVGTWSLAAKVGAVAALSASAVVVPSWVISTRASTHHGESGAANAAAPAHGAAARPLRTNPSSTRALGQSPSEVAGPPAPVDLRSLENGAAPTRTAASTLQSSSPSAAGGSAARTAVAARAPSRDSALGSADSVAEFQPASDAPDVQATTLREETRLIDGALAALRAHDAAAARARLAEHARRYPSGLLYRERVRAERKLEEITNSKDGP
jgi:hypothetical protein